MNYKVLKISVNELLNADKNIANVIDLAKNWR